MFAINSLGRSEPSDVISFITAEEAPGGIPLHIKALALSSTSIKVSHQTGDPICSASVQVALSLHHLLYLGITRQSSHYLCFF